MFSLKHKIRKFADEDLDVLISEQPEKALELVKKARRQQTDNQRSLDRNCAICDKGIHIFKDDYVEIGHKVIHSDHTVRQLEEKGLVGDIETDWDITQD